MRATFTLRVVACIAALVLGIAAYADTMLPSTKVAPSNAASLGFEVYFGGCDAASGFCAVFVRVPSQVHTATWYVPDRKKGESFVDLRIISRPQDPRLQQDSTPYAKFFARGFRGLELNISKNHIATTSLMFATLEDPGLDTSAMTMLWDFGALSQWVHPK